MKKPEFKRSSLPAPGNLTKETAAEAIADVLQPRPRASVGELGGGTATASPKIEAPVRPRQRVTKRTFRWPESFDRQFKKAVHRYNLEKSDEEPDLTVEEAGVIMLKHFLDVDPQELFRRDRSPN